MKKIIFIFIFIVIACNLFAQQKRGDSLTKLRLSIITSFLDLKESDNIADIGTGAGYSLVPIASKYPHITFTVEDLDSTILNKEKLLKQIKIRGQNANIEQFKIVYGTEKSTNLPSASFNKVILTDVIHELAYKEPMLEEIKRILQKDGSIFIEEIFVYKPGKKERGCDYPFLTEEAFKTLMINNHFIMIREATTFNTGKKKYQKIFEYKIK